MTEYVLGDAKLRKYLLDVNHVDGGSKAVWFIRRGVSPDDPEPFAVALLRHAVDNGPGRVILSENGDEAKAVIESPFHGADGNTHHVRTIWRGERPLITMNFVTAYPLRRKP